MSTLSLNDHFEQIKLKFEQLEAMAARQNMEVNKQVASLTDHMFNTIMNYIDRTTTYSGVGLQKGQKQLKCYYAPFYAQLADINNWAIVASIKITDWTYINIAHCGAANMCALLINDFVITINMCTEFIDPKPKTEANKTIQASWKYVRSSGIASLQYAAYVPPAPIFTQPDPQIEQTEQTEDVEEVDEELQRLIADRANEKPLDIFSNPNSYKQSLEASSIEEQATDTTLIKAEQRSQNRRVIDIDNI